MCALLLFFSFRLACDRQIKIRPQYFILAYIRMAIPYPTAKFKSANIFANYGDLGPNRQILIPANISG